MTRLPNRTKLESMTRSDLQKLCKDYGVKANLKTEAIIELLLGVSRPQPSKIVPPTPQRTVSTRRTSSRQSARPRDRSGGSLIVHETESESEQVDPESTETSAPDPPLQAAPRTRKAKDTQTRLGVGRPIVAGGSGARAVTRASSSARSTSKSKFVRGTRSLRSKQATIPEEEIESPPLPTMQSPSRVPPKSGQSSAKRTRSQTTSAPLAPSEPAVVDQDSTIRNPEKNAADEVPNFSVIPNDGPLSLQFADLETRLSSIPQMQNQIRTLTSEVDILRDQVADVATLRADIAQLKLALEHSEHKQGPMPTLVVTPTPMLGPESPARRLVSNSQPFEVGSTPGRSRASSRRGTTPSALGKRSRSSKNSPYNSPEGGSDAGNERGVRPLKKRLKTITEGVDGDVEERTQTVAREHEEGDANSSEPSVFRGPSNQETFGDPTVNHTSDFLAVTSPAVTNTLLLPQAGQSRTATSTALASENQHPLTFSFIPLESSPGMPLLNPMPGFPMPQLPESPSPAGQDSVLRGSGGGIFQASGFSQPTRPRSAASFGLGRASGTGQFQVRSQEVQHEFVNPAFLSSKEVAGENDGNEGALNKRTMYGTESEGDTRFGEFGVEGVGNVGSGFWAGGRY